MKVKIVIVIMLLLAGVPGWSQLKPLTNFYKISELNGLKPTFGTYNVVGYVSKIYECPPCPQGALCKPCMPPHIVISEARTLLAKYALTDREMVVFTESTEGLKQDKKYVFLIKILDVKTTDQAINNPKLIYFEED
ncbi:MAG: hypothetical protein AB7S78_10200 [Candidatus Omnitrophota bacterium]